MIGLLASCGLRASEAIGLFPATTVAKEETMRRAPLTATRTFLRFLITAAEVASLRWSRWVTKSLAVEWSMATASAGHARRLSIVRRLPEELSAAAFLDPLKRLAVGPGGTVIALCLQIRRFERVELHDVDMQSPRAMAGADFARWPIVARSSCRLIVGFIIPRMPRLVLRVPSACCLRRS